MEIKKQHPCPTCNKKMIWTKDNPYRPFCCERCKLIDLGSWASEDHRIAGEEVLRDVDDDKNDF